MRKINWTPKRPSKNNNPYVTARIGNVVLHCYSDFKRNSKCLWYASVYIDRFGRHGPMRKSLARTKKDAILLACELLLDYQTSLNIEMRNFDLLK